MKRYAFVAVVAFFAATAVVGVTAADAGPLANAGLDQEVGVNTTVQLDGTGSSHPDGSIDGYEWSIETPTGARMTPACTDCGRTSFRPTEPGRHNVTVVVTDSEGRSSTDTLYVYVKDYGPTVRLDGDTDPQAGERAPYEATVEANGSDLEELTWRIDGRTVDRETISGRSSATERRFRFSGSGPYRLAVVAEDTTGRSDRDTLVVEPRVDRESRPSSGEVNEAAESTGTTATSDIDCRWSSYIAQSGYACVGDQTTRNDETIVSGYSRACKGLECARSTDIDNGQIGIDEGLNSLGGQNGVFDNGDSDSTDDSGSSFDSSSSSLSDSSSIGGYTDMSGNGNAGRIAF